jgi:hypothetical protein
LSCPFGTVGAVFLKVSFSDGELAELDAVRGTVPRATWVRILVRSTCADIRAREQEAARDGRPRPRRVLALDGVPIARVRALNAQSRALLHGADQPDENE